MNRPIFSKIGVSCLSCETTVPVSGRRKTFGKMALFSHFSFSTHKLELENNYGDDMKLLLMICLLIAVTNSSASCESQARTSLNQNERYLVGKHPLMFKMFIDCSAPDFGIGVVIHESVHMEDLGAPKFTTERQMARWFQNESNIKFNLFTVEQRKIGELSTDQFPTPNKMINRFLEENYKNVLEDESHSLHSLLDGYINDLHTLAARSFSRGLTELNAYGHGLISEHRLKGISNQRYGLLGFTFFLKAYLFQLSKEYPSKFRELMNANNRAYISKIMEQTAGALTISEHCSNMDEIELRDFLPLLADEAFSTPLRSILIDPRILDLMTCK
jgi:hypothetical protein